MEKPIKNQVKTTTAATASKPITSMGAKVLVQGLARLTEGQRCFADEFGLNYDRVFSGDLEQFKGQKPEKVIRQWLLDGEVGAQHLQQLLDDLLTHQLALVAALEGIANKTVDQLSPHRVHRSSPGFLGLRPFAWRSYRNLHRKYEQDDQLRLNELVINGFVSGYIRAREKNSRK